MTIIFWLFADDMSLFSESLTYIQTLHRGGLLEIFWAQQRTEVIG